MYLHGEGEWSALRPGRFTRGIRASDTHWRVGTELNLCRSVDFI